MKQCLYCYKPLLGGETDFHASCSRKIFGSAVAPELPYSDDEMQSLATEIIRSQISVTGVQAKLSLEILPSKPKENKRFTIVGLWGGYILKPQTADYIHLPEVEDLTMHLAELAKIPTVPHSLIHLKSGSLAYITKRLDRNGFEKIPMEDMCQLTERLTEHKYHSSYENIAKTILKYSINPVLDEIVFYEQIVFSFLTGNADMHLKNFSLLKTSEKGFTLMPAYDMVATILVNPADKEELALTLSGKKRKLKRTDFQQAFALNGLDEKSIERIFSKFVKAIPRWFEFIKISFLSETMKSEYVDVITERAKRLEIEYTL
ncbi:MAG TPA: HipA domain-containing protein [Paludibacter sp.]|nr:HipA domain-containing protein [Paludibacter sp.]